MREIGIVPIHEQRNENEQGKSVPLLVAEDTLEAKKQEEEEKKNVDEKEIVDVNEVYAHLCKRWPGRQNEIDMLSDVLGLAHRGGFPALSALCVQSSSANMGDKLVLDALKSYRTTFCHVDCSLISNEKQLYCSILGQLEINDDRLVAPNSKRAKIAASRQISTRKFVEAMQNISSREQDRAIYVLLTHANRLHELDSNALSQHCENDMFGTNVCVVCVAEVDMRGARLAEFPTVLHFRDLPEEDAIVFLCRRRPDDIPSAVFRMLTQQIYRSCWRFCRDLREIEILATTMLPKVRQLCSSHDDPREIMKAIAPTLHGIAFKFVSSHNVNDLTERQSRAPKQHAGHNFPMRQRVLLIAAYLSSWNPIGTDEQFRKQSASKKRRRSRGGGSSTWDKARLRGPQTFTFYRLWENFKGILKASHVFNERKSAEGLEADYVTETSVNDFALINKLVECNLIQRTSSTMNPRYRCLAARSLVEQCAETVKITLHEFLIS